MELVIFLKRKTVKLGLKFLIFSLVVGLALVCIDRFLWQALGCNNFLVLIASVVSLVLAQLTYLQFLISSIAETKKQVVLLNATKQSVEFRAAGFKELTDLHAELNELDRMNREHYFSQKTYSENLSHELLTPLAIIRTKAELLLQAPDLREVDLQHLDSIIQTVGRLSNLNRGLILLSKIDNGQFVDKEYMILRDLVSESLENFEDQIRKKQLSVRVNFESDLALFSNLNLMRVLVANLIKNAVFHNIEQGYIAIELKGLTLRVENSGLVNNLNPNLFFQRFVTDKNTEHSIGLGLSIAQQICLLLGAVISYESNGSVHVLKVNFLEK